MKNALTRSLTRRERVLVLVLVLILVAGAYFYAVHYPITTRLEEIRVEREEIQLNTTVAEAQAAIYRSMQSELEEIFAMPKDEITLMPEYDNIQTLMNYFNVIFAGTDPTLNYDEVRVEENIAERTIRFTFTAQNYAQAKTILGELTDTGYRCLLESVSVNPIEEAAPPAAESPAPAEEGPGTEAEGETGAEPETEPETETETGFGYEIENSRLRVSGTITFYELVV